MIIADRGFSDLWTLAEIKFFDKISSILVRYGTQGWQVQNGYNFLKTNPEKACYKILLCDKNDEILPLQSSLMIGVANELCTIQHNRIYC